jgi:hypothetical protein
MLVCLCLCWKRAEGRGKRCLFVCSFVRLFLGSQFSVLSSRFLVLYRRVVRLLSRRRGRIGRDFGWRGRIGRDFGRRGRIGRDFGRRWGRIGWDFSRRRRVSWDFGRRRRRIGRRRRGLIRRLLRWRCSRLLRGLLRRRCSRLWGRLVSRQDRLAGRFGRVGWRGRSGRIVVRRIGRFRRRRRRRASWRRRAGWRGGWRNRRTCRLRVVALRVRPACRLGAVGGRRRGARRDNDLCARGRSRGR